MRKIARRWVAIIACATLATVSAPIAWAADSTYADNILPTSRFSGCSTATGIQGNAGPCLTDNATLGFWMESEIDSTSSSDTSAEAQINATMSRSYDGTDLNTAYDSSPTFSGIGETDVIFRSHLHEFTDTNTVGYYFCNDSEGSTCDQGYVNLRSVNYSSAYMRALACHETGHAVGLLHPNDSSPAKSMTDTRFECMMNSPMSSHYGLGADPNIVNINDWY
jgi:hypothetical protein